MVRSEGRMKKEQDEEVRVREGKEKREGPWMGEGRGRLEVEGGDR